MRLRSVLTLILSLTGAGPIAADDGSAGLTKEKQSLEAFAAGNKTCHEWTDGCMVCRRQTEARFDCSLPGIACEPTGLACRSSPGDTEAPK